MGRDELKRHIVERRINQDVPAVVGKGTEDRREDDIIRKSMIFAPGDGEARNPRPCKYDVAIDRAITGKGDRRARMQPGDGIVEAEAGELAQQNLSVVQRHAASADYGCLLQPDQQRTARSFDRTRDRSRARGKVVCYYLVKGFRRPYRGRREIWRCQQGRGIRADIKVLGHHRQLDRRGANRRP